MMKSLRKAVIAALCAATLVVGSVAGTMAYLTDKTEEVTNTFTVGKVGITLDETTSVYKMVPGNPIEKDPKVTVTADSEACWLFVKVDKSENYSTYLEDYTLTADWKVLDSTAYPGVYYCEVDEAEAKAGTSKYVLAGNEENPNGVVTVKTEVTTAQMNAALDNPPTLTFTAYAVQRDNVDDVTDAWGYAQQAQSGTTDNQGGTTQE